MAVAEYVTKEDLEAALKPIHDQLDNIEAIMATKADLLNLNEATKMDIANMEARIREDMATKADMADMETRIIQAIQRGTSANF